MYHKEDSFFSVFKKLNMGGHKKHKKKHKKEKKRSKRKSSSSGDSSEEEEWVEKKDSPEKGVTNELERDDWLENADQLFATITRDKSKNNSKEKNKPERPSIDEMGQTSKELNPYWKDGGGGLPTVNTGSKSVGSVGDLGLGWLQRALDRAKQTAKEENRSLEEVVQPVWGSLNNLLNKIKEAESKIIEQNREPKRREDYCPSRPGGSRDGFPSRTYDGRSRRHFRRPDLDEDEHRSHQSRNRKDDSSSKSFMKSSKEYDREYLESNKSKGYRESREGTSDRLDRLRHNHRNTQKSWKKASGDKKESEQTLVSDQDSKYSEDRTTGSSHNENNKSPERYDKSEEKELSISPKFRDNVIRTPSPELETEVEEKPEIITQDEMNRIAAEIMKAEMFGDEEEVKELKERLKKAQSWLSRGGGGKGQQREVILTETDNRGFTRPVQSTSSSKPHSKKRTKVETHKDGKRVRYFGDDDNHSLQDMVQHEKFVSVSDQNEMYAKLAKGAGQKSVDDDFEEGGGREKSEEWAEFSRRQRAALNSTKREKALDLCRFCMDGHNMNRKLVVSIMDKAYISVPPHQSLTEGHCLIIPIQHVTCATLLDEDVWEEVMDLRKLIVNMFLDEDKDVIFYESAKNLNKFPHMILNCIPVSREVGDEAPIYFKKALMECETEWTNNKKVVDLKGRDVRKAVPKGLPYFAVDFGLQSGFAHVIEDERYFPRNFAEEVIGGMMDMHHSIWRKHKKDDQQVQIAKTQEFIKKFKTFMSKK